MTKSAANLVILLVEDNPGDVFMVREALDDAGAIHQVHVVNNGIEAMNFLLRRGPHASAPRPDLVVLDLNLPAKPGREILAEMAASPEIRDVPVAVLTSSRSERDICEAFPTLRATFAVKTPDHRELVGILDRFVQFARPSSPNQV